MACMSFHRVKLMDCFYSVALPASSYPASFKSTEPDSAHFRFSVLEADQIQGQVVYLGGDAQKHCGGSGAEKEATTGCDLEQVSSVGSWGSVLWWRRGLLGDCTRLQFSNFAARRLIRGASETPDVQNSGMARASPWELLKLPLVIPVHSQDWETIPQLSSQALGYWHIYLPTPVHPRLGAAPSGAHTQALLACRMPKHARKWWLPQGCGPAVLATQLDMIANLGFVHILAEQF